MVSVLALSAIDREFEPWSGQTKDCENDKHGILRKKSKDLLARNQDNVSEWGDMSLHVLLFQWASTLRINLTMFCLVQSRPHQVLKY